MACENAENARLPQKTLRSDGPAELNAEEMEVRRHGELSRAEHADHPSAAPNFQITNPAEE
jgi:hypothetical protein